MKPSEDRILESVQQRMRTYIQSTWRQQRRTAGF